jgi:uncharacterized membrane protein
MSLSTASYNNGHTQDQSWLQLSVQKFFLGVNWEDHPPAVQEMQLSARAAAAQGQPIPLSLELSVSQFFAAIAWDGTSIAAANEPVLPSTSQADDFTLDDFTNLF